MESEEELPQLFVLMSEEFEVRAPPEMRSTSVRRQRTTPKSSVSMSEEFEPPTRCGVRPYKDEDENADPAFLPPGRPHSQPKRELGEGSHRKEHGQIRTTEPE